MDPKTHRFLLHTLYVCIILGTVVLLFNDDENRPVALGLFAIFSIALIYHDWCFYKEGSYDSRGRYVYIAELFLAGCIQVFDYSRTAGFYFFMLIAAVILEYKPRFSIPYSVAAIVLNFFILFSKAHFLFLEFWSTNGFFILPRMIILIVIVIAKYAMGVSAQNERLARSLEEKTLMLEEALKQLRSNVEELKETAELRAREKLMGELHDRMGHMLTTAYIGVQAAGVLVDKDIPAAKERLSLSQQQMKEAMHSLRKVISGGAIDMDKQQSFTQSVKDLIAETEKQAGIAIRIEILENSLDTLPAEVRSFLYNALMEGLTNGIRHGEADEFRLKLERSGEGVCFCLRDNGKGCMKLIPGFGLTKMRKDARRLGANLDFSGECGCSLKISVPFIHTEEAHE